MIFGRVSNKSTLSAANSIRLKIVDSRRRRRRRGFDPLAKKKPTVIPSITKFTNLYAGDP